MKFGNKKEPEESKEKMYGLPEDKKPLRLVGLYGDLDEEKGAEIVYSLMALDYSGVYEKPILVPLTKKEKREQEKFFEDNELSPFEFEPIEFKESNKKEKVIEPIEFLISTNGGTASDMFAIYDTMKSMTCPIETKGMGKVMSAGTLLLAAGEKGKRSIGSNCRVMIHSVIGGHHGNLDHVKNELKEIDWVQEKYIKCMAKETKLTEKQIRKMIVGGLNCYLSAEESVKCGIADIIV